MRPFPPTPTFEYVPILRADLGNPLGVLARWRFSDR